MVEKNPKNISSQPDKFRQVARELGVDESEDRFNAALGKIARHKPPPDDKLAKPAEKKPGS